MEGWFSRKGLFGGKKGEVGEVVGGGKERLTDGVDLEVDFKADGLVHPSSAVQDGGAGAAMGIGVAGFGLRDRGGSRGGSCMGDGGEEGEDDRGSDGLHFGRIGGR